MGRVSRLAIVTAIAASIATPALARSPYRYRQYAPQLYNRSGADVAVPYARGGADSYGYSPGSNLCTGTAPCAPLRNY
jgi:hypothetical protein